MKRTILSLLLVLALGSSVWAADGDWNQPVPFGGLTAGDVIYAKDANTISNKAMTVTDGTVFLDAPQNCSVASGALVGGLNQGPWDTASRVSSTIWAIARQANTTATESYAIGCQFNSWLQRSGGTVGIKINSLRLAYEITGQQGTANIGLASHYWGKLATLVYANNAAIGLSGDMATTPTLATATQAFPYLTTVTVTTPAYLPASANTGLFAEWVVSIKPSTIYRLYGVVVSFTRLDH